MSNKKGFTLVELITSFALAAIVLVFVFNVVVILKNDYVGKSLRTNLMIKQSLLSQKINEDLKDNNVIGVRTCDSEDKCYEFTFVDNKTKKLLISNNGKIIKYGNFTYNLIGTSYTEKIGVEIIKGNVDNTTINDSFLIIKLPVYNSKFNDLDFGINCIYQFNSNINDLSIVAAGS